MIEVEIRAKIKSIEEIKSKLVSAGADFVKTERQVDKVFGREKDLSDDHKIMEGHFSARIRQVDDSVKVEFKEICRTGSGLEFSSRVPKTMDGIKFLEKLDFIEAFTVAKVRNTYKLGDFEICLDEVEKLGNFIEIEHASKNGENVAKLLEECKTLLSKLDPKAVLESKKYGDLMQELLNLQ